MSVAGRRIEVRGAVQGVGFRPWIWRLARAAGISGRVRNDDAGVVIEAFAPEATLDDFVARLRETPPAAAIEDLRWRGIPVEATEGFVIEPSRSAEERRISIPPDLGVCDACAAEIFDPGDRRHRYPFTNCVSCGPRFTILCDLPYDRPATTMAGFAMCERCCREYDSPGDRRFHAQPNACPACGPRLTLAGAADPLAAAAALLRDGRIVAVKGIGGFHLACDATSSAAVARLRERKAREEKPFAVMVRDVDAAAALAELGADERRLLCAPERPIVLVRRRPDAPLAPEVAPNNPLVGLLLAYSPLHHLLLREVGRPLVMTSGNRSDEPIASGNAEAERRLAGIADAFLVHDRDIATACDDSVARVVAGRATLLRRARGYVPRPVRLARPVERPVLACGGQLKNAVCVAVGDLAYLGPHVGDLDGPDTYERFAEGVEVLERLLRVRPEVIAHDLHPDYLSTRYALSRGAHAVGVQHHHAHIAAVMAEHRLAGPVLGVAYDGSGLGTDGTAWGGEILHVELGRFERLATLRPLPLAGGDRAVHQVWRLALAALDDAFDGDPPLAAFPLFAAVGAGRVQAVRDLIAKGVQTPRAHGLGRYFDAVGALALGRATSAYEGQVPLEWSEGVDPGERGSYGFALDGRTIDTRPMVRAAATDLAAGASSGAVAARFMNTVAAATAAAVRAAAERVGRLPVALGGGCFQNPFLVAAIERELSRDFAVHRAFQAPPGDGGLALGQAVVADAVARANGG